MPFAYDLFIKAFLKTVKQKAAKKTTICVKISTICNTKCFWKGIVLILSRFEENNLKSFLALLRMRSTKYLNVCNIMKINFLLAFYWEVMIILIFKT
jgi:hypothetical protein